MNEWINELRFAVYFSKEVAVKIFGKINITIVSYSINNKNISIWYSRSNGNSAKHVFLKNIYKALPLSEKCPNTEFFLACIFRIWTEYGHLLCKTPCSVQIRENIDQKKLSIWTFFAQCTIDLNLEEITKRFQIYSDLWIRATALNHFLGEIPLLRKIP